MPEDKDHIGHRDRLRERFIKSNGDALADYEMLELLLFQAIPRRDTKPLAKALIRRFGSFSSVIRADTKALREVKGVGDSVIVTLKSVAAAASRLAREEILQKPVLNSWNLLVDYLRVNMAHEKNEQFRILFLDTKNILIMDEIQQTGTVNHTPVYPREVIKRALELGATAIIMVHNHPSGDPTPSDADVDMTLEVQDAGKKLGVTLHDHVIIARGGHTSLRSMGLI